jgi:hypothetical protein
VNRSRGGLRERVNGGRWRTFVGEVFLDNREHGNPELAWIRHSGWDKGSTVRDSSAVSDCKNAYIGEAPNETEDSLRLNDGR